MKFCQGLFLLSALSCALTGMAQLRPGTYASVNSFEKVCLRLNENQRFQMFSSNCTTDRDFSGQWQQRGDTLVLNSDQGPTMALGQVSESATGLQSPKTPGEALAEEAHTADSNTGYTSLVLRSADAPLLRSIRVSMGGQSVKPDARGELKLRQPLNTIYFFMEGMAELRYTPEQANAAQIQVEILFHNLDKPSLFNDRWLARGRQLSYLPGPGSTRSADIALQRGKRCFYKIP